MSQQRLDALVRRTRAEARSLADEHSSGRIDARTFGRRLADLLEDRHTEAVIIGRRHGGDDADEEDDDRLFAVGVVDDELEFIQGFVSALEKLDVPRDAVARRAESYANRLTGTANETLVLAADEPVWNWVLGSSDHCGDCVDLAQGGPYRMDELPTYPGSNDTNCLYNCRCSIVAESGLAGFRGTD